LATVVTATLPPGRVRLEPRANLLKSVHRGSVSINLLPDRGKCRLEPHLYLDALEGERGLWAGEIAGPTVIINVR
jgi:hypothetical protein